MLRRAVACGLLAGALVLPAEATAAVQQADGDAFIAAALGTSMASPHVDGALKLILAEDARLFRVGEGPAIASPAITVERGAYATISWAGHPSELFGSGGAFDCARPTVACPATELRLERFDSGATLFAWDLAGAPLRPVGSQILRIAVLAHDPRFPLLNDTRPNTPFTRVNKIWVMDYTATAETMRYFQAERGGYREFPSDAIAGFNADRGFTAIAPQAFEGVTEWNLHTYSLAGPEEGGHSLVAPGGAMIPVTGPTVQITPAPPEPCAPRPPVSTAVTSPGGGVLEVTVKAGKDALTGLEVSDGANYVIEPQTPLQIPAGATEFTFRVRRTGPGSVYVPLTVTDGCGAWPTFVGGGPTAF